MDVYLFPDYVSISSAFSRSKGFAGFLLENNITAKRKSWHGTLASLPKTPSIIRASKMMECNWIEFGQKCAELGHVCFYDDQLILPNGGKANSTELINAVKEFLKKNPTAK